MTLHFYSVGKGDDSVCVCGHHKGRIKGIGTVMSSGGVREDPVMRRYLSGELKAVREPAV